MQEIIYDGGKPKYEIHDVFTLTMEELIKEDSDVMYIDADIMGSMKSRRLWIEYPENVVNTGIQEANMVGVAAGYNLIGLKPYIHSFTPFISRRVFDQVFLSVGYAKKSVRMIGSDAGIAATYNGGTHMCFEDVALFRTIPEACIVDISDAQMLRSFLHSTKDRQGVTYIRTPRRDLPDIYPEGTEFEEGKAKILKEGDDATIIASGIMVGTAIEASQILEKEGINARVVDIVTIKPLDKELVLKCAEDTGLIVSAENHNVIGGLGAAIAEYLSETKMVPVMKIGIQDQYGQVGSLPYLRQAYNLTAEAIVKKVKKGMLIRE